MSKYTSRMIFYTICSSIALFIPLPTPIRAILAIIFFVGQGYVAGKIFFPRESRYWQIFFGFFLFTATNILTATIIYYIYRLDTLMTMMVFLLTTALLYIFVTFKNHDAHTLFASSSFFEKNIFSLQKILTKSIGIIMNIVYVCVILYGLSILSTAATTTSLRSPWDLAPRMFFVLFFVLVVGLFTLAYNNLAPSITLLPIMGLMFLATTVAALIYTIGYGFDPFIHQATELAIFKFGFIDPKPFYYIGHYVTITIIARLLDGNIATIDTLLVPCTLALVIPCAYWSLKKTFDWSSSIAAASSLILFILPFSSFIPSTPQGFANAVFLITVFLALPTVVNKTSFPLWGLFLLASTTLAIHPLTGIPLFIFLTLLFSRTYYAPTHGIREIGRRILLLKIILLGSIALPLIFILNAWITKTAVFFNTALFKTPSIIMDDLQFTTVITRQFMLLYDFVYSWHAIQYSALLLAGFLGIWLFERHSKKGEVYLFGALIFLANFILLRSFIRFPFLISYERTNYADRLLDLTIFLLSPMIVTLFGFFLIKLQQQRALLKIGTAFLLASLATSSLYLNYPRRDKYESSRGWSTSTNDIKAVHLIDSDAKEKLYVVLANQVVSAGAVREFGFKHYYPSKATGRPGQIFYYPIPTGEILYEYFLEMNKTGGSAVTAHQVMDLTGVDTVYFVVSYYWWDAQSIVVKAKTQADRSWVINDKNFVFKYTR